MSDVLDELAEEADGKLTRAHVERRVSDWSNRISKLYRQIGLWLPEDFSTRSTSAVTMREEMMERYQVPPTKLPVLEILKGGSWLGKVVPNGLWIIGANGRADLFVREVHFLLVDRSENFADSNWTIAPSAERRVKQQMLTQETFLKALLG